MSTLLDSGDQLNEATRTQLLENIRDESNWLVSVVENLLSVTRMTGEQTKIKKEMEAGEEVLSAAAMKIKKHYPDIDVSVHAPQELLMIPMDVILIEQVLINLMENAIQHGGTTTRVELQLQKMASARDLRSRTTDRASRERFSEALQGLSLARRGIDGGRPAEYGHRAFGLHEHCAGARRHDAGGKPGNRRCAVQLYTAIGGI